MTARLRRAGVIAIVAGGLAVSDCGGYDGISRVANMVGERSGPVLKPIKAKRATLWAVGDAGADTDGTRAVARLIARGDPDRVLYLGDVYPRGTASDFADGYRPVWGRFNRITAPTPGNHEWDTRHEGYLPYWERVHGTPMPLHYSFRVGRWQLISVTTEDLDEMLDDQIEWLRAKLAAQARFGSCRIAFWHRPVESAGLAHGDDPRLEPLWDELAGRARIVVAAHDHAMQRLRKRAGITPLISGAGGFSNDRIDENDPRLRFGDDRRDGALRILLRGRRARLAFVAANGKVLDRSRVWCRSPVTRASPRTRSR